MANALLLKVIAAKKDGADLHAVLKEILHQKCQSDGRVCSLAFVFWLLSTLVFFAAVLGLILGDKIEGIPLVGSMEVGHLQAAATGCGIVSSALFMTFLRLRQEQTKHTFLLILVMEGSVKDAASLLFGGEQRRASNMALDVVDTAFGALN